MSKLGDIAKKAVGLQTMKIDDIIKDYGGVVTINGLSYAEYKGKTAPVLSFVECKGRPFWGTCKTLREMVEAWEEEFGDLRTINEELAVEGVKIKLSPMTMTKGGNKFRPVAVLGTVKFDTELEPAEVVDEETGEVQETAPF